MPIKISKEAWRRAVSVILRVPSLFIAEAWYRTSPTAMQQQYLGKGVSPDRSQEILIQVVYYSAILIAIALAFLPLKKLVNFYMYIASAGLITIAHYMSFIYVEAEKNVDLVESIFDDAESIQRLGLHLVVQGVIAAVIAYILGLHQWTKLTLLIYVLPMCARVVNYPTEELHRVHNFSSVFMLLVVVFYLFNCVPQVLDLVKSAMQKVTLAVQLYGWIPFLVAGLVWFKILLPVQLLIFWLILFALQLFKYIGAGNHPILAEGWIVVLLASIGECCVSPISLMGLCVTISYVSYMVLQSTKFYLQGRDALHNQNVMHQGWTEGFTMFLLGLQTGIIELKATQRAFLMSIVLFIVLSSLIQSMYEITDPILLALGASQSRHVWRHVRAVLLCTFLWMFPLYMTYMISQFFDLDFWLMVVISSCILTSVQVLGTLVVYMLFVYDALRDTVWEGLDDVVYYAKATTRVLEFIVAVLVVAYGVVESIVGEWSWVNSSILIIHCYFNVWQRLQSGWKTYLLRREAAQKIEQLPEATPEQLARHNDVCAICFQEMLSAKVTACEHYFHALCLRKWLYVKEKCPMCHQDVAPKPPDGEDRNNENVEENLNDMQNLAQVNLNSLDGDNNIEREHADDDGDSQAAGGEPVNGEALAEPQDLEHCDLDVRSIKTLRGEGDSVDTCAKIKNDNVKDMQNLAQVNLNALEDDGDNIETEHADDDCDSQAAGGEPVNGEALVESKDLEHCDLDVRFTKTLRGEGESVDTYSKVKDDSEGTSHSNSPDHSTNSDDGSWEQL